MPPPPLPPGRREASPGDQRPPPNPPPPHPTQTRGRAGGRPPNPPPPHPPQQGSHRHGPPPPQSRGGAPPLRRNGDAVRATAAGPAPANPHRRAGATRTTEQEGGRAPHDPPVTTAHSEVTEGGFQVGWGPQGSGLRAAPPPPPPPRGGTSAPTARARQNGARRRHGESQKGVPQAAARNESREAAARHPPPPAPPPARQPRGARPPPPEAGGMDPPCPRGEPECDPPPRPSRRLKWGPRRTSGPTPAHRDAAQIVPREAGWARTGVVWGATPPMDSTTPVTPASLPAQGKRRATSRGRECGDNKRGGKPAAPQPANH